MKNRKLVSLISGVVLLGLIIAAVSTTVFLRLNAAHASSANSHDGHNLSLNGDYRVASTINNLDSIAVVGSTAFIVDGHGRTIATDANPYGVAIVPNDMSTSSAQGTLRPGDIVVTNIGGMDAGTTIVRFPGGKGPGLLFNTTANPGTKGPAFEAFNALSGTDWIANIMGGNVQVFRPNGTVLTTVTSLLFNKPWGVATNHGVHNSMDGSVISFFVSNVADATIDRVDVIPTNHGPTFRFFQIGQLTSNGKETKLNMVWVPSLQIGRHLYVDVLLVLDIANNRVAAFPNSTTMNTTMMRSTNKGMTVFAGKPLNAPGGIAINPLNGDLLVANLND